MAELEPLLGLSEAERIFLAHVLSYRKRDRIKRLEIANARLEELSPSEVDFEPRAKIARRISYAIAMCDVLAERLGINIDNPPAWREDDS